MIKVWIWYTMFFLMFSVIFLNFFLNFLAFSFLKENLQAVQTFVRVFLCYLTAIYRIQFTFTKELCDFLQQLISFIVWENTWVLSSFISVHKAGYEHRESEQSYGAHESDEPSLVGDASMNTGQTCERQNIHLPTHIWHILRTFHWMLTSTENIWH